MIDVYKMIFEELEWFGCPEMAEIAQNKKSNQSGKKQSKIGIVLCSKGKAI